MAHMRCAPQTLLQQSVDSLKIEYVVRAGRHYSQCCGIAFLLTHACLQGSEALVTLPYEFMKEARAFRFAMREPRAQPAVAVIPYYERCVFSARLFLRVVHPGRRMWRALAAFRCHVVTHSSLLQR